MSSEDDVVTADPSDEDSDDPDSQTIGLYINLGIGIPVTLLCILLFDPIRRKFPHIFETRRKLNEDRELLDHLGNRVSTPPAPSYHHFGWLLPTLRLEPETLTDTHGLDTALFLRYHRFMLALFTALLIPSLILLPTYYTATDGTTPAKELEKGINVFSISNITEGDPWRYWMVLAMEYLIGGFVCYHLFYHFMLYCRDRRRYRSARHPANYAILVQDVPRAARTADAVQQYWDRVFPGQISSVFYVHDARRLEKMKANFWKVVSRRETAEWRLHATHQRNQRRAEKRALRNHRKRFRKPRHKSFTLEEPPPLPETTEQDLETGVHDSIPSEYVTSPKPVLSLAEQPSPVRKAMDDAMLGADDEPMQDEGNESGLRQRYCGIIPKRGPPKQPEAAVVYWEKAQRRAWAKVMAYQSQREEGHFATTTTAIVVFRSRRSASVAAQTNFSRVENEWRVSRAPEPNAVDWSALCVPGWTIYLRQAITILLSVALILFWIAPVTAIMSVVSITDLVNLKIGSITPFSLLKGLQDQSKWIIGFIESWLPTMVLSLFLNFVPSIFGLFVSISRITSLAERDRQVRDWNFTFMTFSNFLFVAFAGTLLKELSKILKQPHQAVTILAGNIPKQAAFMMNFILLTALTETPRELLQFGRVVISYVKLKLIARTQRHRDEALVGDCGADFVGLYSTSQLVTLLGLVYCTIQPFITVCCIVYFAVTYVVMKYNLCYSLHNEYEDGGRMYGGALYGVWVGLFSHLLTMIGVFGLNKSVAQSALIIIPAVLSVLFVLHCRRSFARVLEHGSALETQDRVETMEGCAEDIIEEELAETYEHPGWEELPDYDDLENLNGLGDDNTIDMDESFILDEEQMDEEQMGEEQMGEKYGKGREDSRGSEKFGEKKDSQGSLSTKVKQMSTILSDLSGEATMEIVNANAMDGLSQVRLVDTRSGRRLSGNCRESGDVERINHESSDRFEDFHSINDVDGRGVP